MAETPKVGTNHCDPFYVFLLTGEIDLDQLNACTKAFSKRLMATLGAKTSIKLRLGFRGAVWDSEEAHVAVRPVLEQQFRALHARHHYAAILNTAYASCLSETEAFFTDEQTALAWLTSRCKGSVRGRVVRVTTRRSVRFRTRLIHSLILHLREENMAPIYKEIFVEATPESARDAVRDVGAVHRRLVPGYVVNTRLEGDERILTFADGGVARELIMMIDEERHRLAYAVIEARMPLTRHHASLQIFAEGEGSRLVWITDALPHERAAEIAARVERGAEIMKQTLELAAQRV